MMRTGGSGNPFRPGAGQMPPFLAGRDAELGLAEKRLADLSRGVPPAQGILFFGPRGNGKTVLLERIASRARELGMRAERLPAEALRSRDLLVRLLQERAGLRETRVTGVSLGPIGASAERAAPTGNISALLGGWIAAPAPPLVLILDEIHTMDPETGRAFFEAVQHAASDARPLFLIAAGTPDAPRKVRYAGTFAERAFERLPIGRLSPAATVAALSEPARDAGRPIEDEGLARLARESQNYPYFIQLLGRAAWEAASDADETMVHAEAAERGVSAARVAMERFYLERFDEARERDVDEVLAPLAERMVRGRGRMDDGDLSALLRRMAREDAVPYNRVSLLTTLRDLGVVWETASAAWEMGIPSFADYVLRRAGRSRADAVS